MRIGLFIGRFQPLHKGHLEVLSKALKSVDRLIVVIGSSQASDARNCFTLAERKKMVRAAITPFRIIALRDYPDDAMWTKALLRLVGHVDVVFCSNAHVRRLLRSQGIAVVPSKSRHRMHGTAIRKKILLGKDWQKDVPKQVAALITQKHQRRLQKLYKRP
jgi:nicotinamide-nucleotide adenylyltransferase